METVHKDFHGALSCAFRFLDKKYGKKALREYLHQAGENIYGDLITKIKREGLVALENYWRRIFAIEGGEFEIKANDNTEITLVVRKCPALTHMKQMKYAVYKDFCLQCKVINEVVAERSSLRSEFTSNQSKNSCVQKLRKG